MFINIQEGSRGSMKFWEIPRSLKNYNEGFGMSWYFWGVYWECYRKMNVIHIRGFKSSGAWHLIYIVLRSGKLILFFLPNCEIDFKQIEWENVLWECVAAFWLGILRSFSFSLFSTELYSVKYILTSCED